MSLPEPDLTHFDRDGQPRMVAVTEKPVTRRLARAEAIVTMQPATRQRVAAGTLGKGDVTAVARLAGMMAAKRTGELIPLCHPLGLDACSVEIELLGQRQLRIVATTEVHGRTGVEMEALTAASIAALTVYDMCKAIDKTMEIGPIRLLEKQGGRSGHFLLDPSAQVVPQTSENTPPTTT